MYPKQKIDEVFNNSSLNVQFDGLDEAVTAPFVRLHYRASSRDRYAFDGSLKGKIKEVIKLDVYCYDHSVNKVIELQKQVLDLIECKEFGNLKVGLAEPDGLGAQPLGNGLFESLITFDLINYN